MSIPALLNVNQLAARKGAHELEFAVKKVHSLDTSKGGPEGYLEAIIRRVAVSYTHLTLPTKRKV